MRVGYLPVSVMSYVNEYDHYFTQIGLYATDHAFRMDTPSLKTCTVPFPLGLSTKRLQDLEDGLRVAGNSEETVRVIRCGMIDRDPQPWIDYFGLDTSSPGAFGDQADDATETPVKRIKREREEAM